MLNLGCVVPWLAFQTEGEHGELRIMMERDKKKRKKKSLRV